MEVLPRNTSSVMGSIVNSIQTFASQNSMRLNPKKYLVRARTKIPYTYVLNGTPLKEAGHTKYLGILFSKDLKWNKHIDVTIAKATLSLSLG